MQWRALLACTLWTSTALAHNLSQGTCRFQVEGAEVRAELALVAADYDALLGTDSHGTLSPAAADAMLPALRTYLAEALRVDVPQGDHAVACPGELLGVDVAAAAGVPLRVPLRLRFTCPEPPERLRIRFGLFLGTGVQHTNVGSVLWDGQEQELLFTATRREALVAGPHRAWGALLRAFYLLGVEHILSGQDHLLFLAVLLLGVRRLGSAAWMVTSFTLAHSITLAVAALDVVRLPPRLVESAVAATILVVALEDGLLAWRRREPRVPRTAVALGFGLIHGFAFASALGEAGLPREGMLGALAAFNLGVETGQLGFCAALFLALAGLRRTRWERPGALGLSAASAAVAAAWLVTRALG